MIPDLLATVAPIYVIAGLGFFWARLGRPYDTRVIGELTTNIAAPCLVFSSLSRLEVDPGAVAELAWAALAALVAFAAIGWIGLRVAKMPVRSFLPPLVFGNTGNMGLAVCYFAFGDEGVAYGVVFFTVVTLVHFTAGLWVWSGEASPVQMLKTPLFWATVLAVGGIWFDVHVPDWIVASTSSLGDVAVPMMQFTLGVSISSLAIDRLPRALYVSLLRLGMGLAVGVVLADLFGFEGTLRGVMILDCAMPVAVVNSLFAERYGRHPSEVASTVVLSTLLSFGTLPLILAWVG